MQLAATQRPHPPPVPPRPSRQVVAEALKRSPGGPPCPTRQAPPPPSNARPWRAREPERVAAGRPVIFASTARHTADDGAALSDAGESSRVNVEVSSPATRIEGDPGGATTEKNDESCAPPGTNVAGKPEEAPREEKDATSRPQEATESSRTIASVDCATVVVVVDDEPERRVAFEDADNIRHQDWLEAGVRYSSTRITLPGDERCDVDEGAVAARLNAETEAREDEGSRVLDFSSIRERIAMSTLQGLPPLPRSLSGFDLNATEPPPPPARSSSKVQRSTKTVAGSRPSPPARQLTTLDTQLAVLRREMFGLRQLDLSLLSQLWSLNESIQEFRQLLQEQEDRAPSPSPSSEEGDDTSYGSQPPPPPRRPGPVVHHHRPPRPPRPPPSDESPSSEEYGAV